MMVACLGRKICKNEQCDHYFPHEHHSRGTTCAKGACMHADPYKVSVTECGVYKGEEPTWIL